MQPLAELAGFLAAHAFCSIADGAGMTPMLAFEGWDGQRSLTRLTADDPAEAVAAGRESLTENTDAATLGLLVFDGYLTLGDDRIDAVFVEATQFLPTRDGFTLAVPYRAPDDPAGFAVHKFKFLHFEEPDTASEPIALAFFRGIESHEAGAKIWAEALDESR